MANFTMAQLKDQFRNMDREIKATLSMLQSMEGSTVIVGICPPCAPLMQDPPRLFSRCADQIGMSKVDITIDDAEATLVLLESWSGDILTVIEGALDRP